MTDHEAMGAINAALEEYYRGRLTQHEVLIRIARITEQNPTEPQEAS